MGVLEGEALEKVREELGFLVRYHAKTPPEFLMMTQGRFRAQEMQLTREDLLREMMRDGSVGELLSESSESAERLLLAMLRKERGAASHVRWILAHRVQYASDENPTLWLLWGWCGLILEQEHDVTEARWHLRNSRIHGARLEALEAALRGNDAQRAERMSTLLSMAPQEASVLRSALVSFMKVGQNEDGFRTAMALLQQAPQDPLALFVVGTKCLVQGEADVAYSYLKRAELTGEDSPTLLNNLAEAAVAVGKLDEALDYIQRAHEALPNNEDILTTLKSIQEKAANSDSVNSQNIPAGKK